MKIIGSSIQQLDKLRENGTNIPRSKCRKWRLWVTTDQGRKSRRFSGTWTQATDALAAFVSEIEESVPNADTFATYAESWREWREKSGDIEESTAVNDRRNVAVLSRELGEERMDSITPERVKRAIINIRTSGERELSGTYMNNLFTALNSIMRTACDDGRIASNPCAKVKPPRCDTEEKAALDSTQIDALWQQVDPLARIGDGRAMAVLIILDAGLRLGETLALSPKDVDIANGVIHVRHSRKERTGKLGKTKRPASVRDLPMTGRLRASCAAYSEVRPDCPAFCASTHGCPLLAQNFRRWWDKRAPLWGCDGFTPHQLRHSNLTKMARYMSVFDLQRWAGWSSIGPAKVYVHADRSAMEAAVLRSQIGLAQNPTQFERTKNAPEESVGQTA